MSEDINFGKTKIELPQFDFKKIRKTIFLGLVVIILMGSFYTVNANENGVVLRLGKYSHTTQPGLQFKIPFIDNVFLVKENFKAALEVACSLLSISKNIHPSFILFPLLIN